MSDRKSLRRRAPVSPWAWRSGVLALVAVVVWAVAVFTRGGLRPGDPVGMAFGIAATVLMVVAALYAWRRRAMSLASRLRLGGARGWLQLHIYGGALFLLLVLLHSGLRWPSGLMSWSLWLLSVWTVITGSLGLLLQRTIPRVLASRPGLEVNYDRIPELVDELRQRAEALVAEQDAALRGFYSSRLAPVLAGPRRDPLAFFGSGEDRRRLEPLAHLRTLMSAEQQSQIQTLEDLYTAKLDLDTHYTLQQALRGWLWIHVPPSILLLAVVLAHILSVVYY